MKMIKMGKKNSVPEAIEPSKEEKEKIYYPSINLHDVVPEAIFNKKVGDIFEIKAVCKLTNKSVNESDNRSNKSVGFDILELGVDDSEGDLEEEIKRQSDIK